MRTGRNNSNLNSLADNNNCGMIKPQAEAICATTSVIGPLLFNNVGNNNVKRERKLVSKTDAQDRPLNDDDRHESFSRNLQKAAATDIHREKHFDQLMVIPESDDSEALGSSMTSVAPSLGGFDPEASKNFSEESKQCMCSESEMTEMGVHVDNGQINSPKNTYQQQQDGIKPLKKDVEAGFLQDSINEQTFGNENSLEHFSPRWDKSSQCSPLNYYKRLSLAEALSNPVYPLDRNWASPNSTNCGHQELNEQSSFVNSESTRLKQFEEAEGFKRANLYSKSWNSGRSTGTKAAYWTKRKALHRKQRSATLAGPTDFPIQEILAASEGAKSLHSSLSDSRNVGQSLIRKLSVNSLLDAQNFADRTDSRGWFGKLRKALTMSSIIVDTEKPTGDKAKGATCVQVCPGHKEPTITRTNSLPGGSERQEKIIVPVNGPKQRPDSSDSGFCDYNIQDQLPDWKETMPEKAWKVILPNKSWWNGKQIRCTKKPLVPQLNLPERLMRSHFYINREPEGEDVEEGQIQLSPEEGEGSPKGFGYCPRGCNGHSVEETKLRDKRRFARLVGESNMRRCASQPLHVTNYRPLIISAPDPENFGGSTIAIDDGIFIDEEEEENDFFLENSSGGDSQLPNNSIVTINLSNHRDRAKSMTFTSSQTGSRSSTYSTGSSFTCSSGNSTDVKEESRCYAFALRDNVSTEAQDLSFRRGDVIQVVECSHSCQLWYGKLESLYGWFPSSYVKLLSKCNDSSVMDEVFGEVKPESSDGAETSAKETPVPSAKFAKKDRWASMRSNVIREILSTEKDYVKLLEDIVEGFLYQARRRVDMFSEDQIALIFGNIETILALHYNFLVELEKSIKDWNRLEEAPIGHCFLRYESFSVYSDYCNNHPRSNNEMIRLYSIPRYQHFFEACRLLRGMTELNLSAFLLSPVQRICKYPLQLSELLKWTPLSHSDHLACSAALRAMRNVATRINDRKRRLDSLQELIRWQLVVQNWHGLDIVDTSTSLVHCGEVVCRFLHCDSPSWVKSVYMFLFDHLLVFCKRDVLKKENFLFKARICTDDLIITSVADGRDTEFNTMVKNGFKLRFTCPNNCTGANLNEKCVYLMACRSRKQKDDWLDAFRRERQIVQDASCCPPSAEEKRVALTAVQSESMPFPCRETEPLSKSKIDILVGRKKSALLRSVSSDRRVPGRKSSTSSVTKWNLLLSGTIRRKTIER